MGEGDPASDLYGDTLERVGEVVRAPGTVVLPGADAPFYAKDVRGRLWVAKVYDAMPRRSLLAECLGFLLGVRVEAAQPRGGVGTVGGAQCWLSRCVGTDVRHLSLETLDNFSNLYALAASLWVDTVLFDADRHEANYIVSIDASDADMKEVWAIDRANAQVVARSNLDAVDRPLQRSDYPPHFPFDLLREDAMAVARSAEGIRRETVREMVQSAQRAAGCDGFDWVVEPLSTRIERAAPLLDALFESKEAD